LKYKINLLLAVVLLAIPFISVFAQTNTQILDFAKAAKFDDAKEVKFLIGQGLSPNTIDSNGNPMLVLAIKDRSYGVIDVLLTAKDMDVDLSNKQGETPLMYAAINGDLPLVKTLVLKNKAQLDHIGWTPLHYACAKGHFEVAQFLLSKGAIADSLSLGGTTPLMMAVQSGNEFLVRLLLNSGANLQLRNDVGLTAIDIADIYNKPQISEGLRLRWLKLYRKPYVGSVIDPQSKPQ
jgi:ankyrin repeat protein